MESATSTDGASSSRHILPTSQSIPSSKPPPVDNQKTSTSTTLAMFTCFPDLPTELRLIIWRYSACLDPKNIVLDAKSVLYHYTSTDESIPTRRMGIVPDSAKIFVWYRATSNALSPPALLHVSSEARTIAFEFYRPEKSTERFQGSFNTPYRGSYQCCVWVNWFADTLLLERNRRASGLLAASYPLVLDHISKVARELPKHSLQVAFSGAFANDKWLAGSSILELIKTVIIYGKEFEYFQFQYSPWERKFILAPFSEELDELEVPKTLQKLTLLDVTGQKGKLISEFDRLPADAKGETVGSKLRDMQLMLLKIDCS
ncbi:hypothetical protein HYALB_00012877 [Hymenoscyphus albidus]|uniref:2EXR domain-containing protein n=1 Tax=Hymenoscyphus albidus TaxID=595503 RepID=A0A9N9Q7S8_9HELO|nr:hypothetical protein HYALB_00012877 [Hymenoscyphus albidus]